MLTPQYGPRSLLVWLVAAAVIASGILPPAIARAKDQNFPGCTRVQSNFGRMFSSLPAARWAAADVDLLAGKVMAMQEAEETPEGQADPKRITTSMPASRMSASSSITTSPWTSGPTI